MKKLNLLLLTSFFTVMMVCVSSITIAGTVGNYPGKWYGWWCPYEEGGPPLAGVIPEVENQKVIKSWGHDTGNSFEEIKDLIPEFFYNEVLLNPEIWGAFRINETEYIPTGAKPWLDATEKYKGVASLDERGHIQNYKAGCPFPGTTNALEIGWNIIKRRANGDNIDYPFVWQIVDKKGHTRWVAALNYYMFYDGRLALDPLPLYEPNPRNIEFVQGCSYTAPYDLRGTVVLAVRYDSPVKQDDMWMYLPSLRRVRRMSTAQRWDRLPGGGDLFWDNLEMFWGKPTNYEWKYLGRKMLLCSHNAKAEAQSVKNKIMGGVDNYFSRVNTVVIEVVPMEHMRAPVSKFVLYLDPIEYLPLWGVYYDKKGKPWIGNLFEASWDANWIRTPYNMLEFDLQRKHFTGTYLRNFGANVEKLVPEFFEIDNLKKMAGGR